MCTHSQVYRHQEPGAHSQIHLHFTSPSRFTLSSSQRESHTHPAMLRHKSNLSRHVHIYAHAHAQTHVHTHTLPMPDGNLWVPRCPCTPYPGLCGSRFLASNTLRTHNLGALTSTSAERELLRTSRLPDGNLAPGEAEASLRPHALSSWFHSATQHNTSTKAL